MRQVPLPFAHVAVLHPASIFLTPGKKPLETLEGNEEAAHLSGYLSSFEGWRNSGSPGYKTRGRIHYMTESWRFKTCLMCKTAYLGASFIVFIQDSESLIKKDIVLLHPLSGGLGRVSAATPVTPAI